MMISDQLRQLARDFERHTNRRQPEVRRFLNSVLLSGGSANHKCCCVTAQGKPCRRAGKHQVDGSWYCTMHKKSYEKIGKCSKSGKACGSGETKQASPKKRVPPSVAPKKRVPIGLGALRPQKKKKSHRRLTFADEVEQEKPVSAAQDPVVLSAVELVKNSETGLEVIKEAIKQDEQQIVKQKKDIDKGEAPKIKTEDKLKRLKQEIEDLRKEHMQELEALKNAHKREKEEAEKQRRLEKEKEIKQRKEHEHVERRHNHTNPQRPSEQQFQRKRRANNLRHIL